MKNILLKVMAVALVMALGATVAWAQGPAQSSEPSEPTGETVSVTIRDLGSGTLYTDKALSFEETGLTAYIAKLSGGETVLSEVQDVPAYTGVVIMGDPGSYDIPVIDTSYTDVSGNKLAGSLVEKRIASNDTITYYAWTRLNSTGEAGFARISEGGINAPAGKAYLAIESVSLAAKAQTISFNGYMMSVESVEDAQPEEDSPYYNIMGMPVENPHKGLYIKNGKKVIVK